MVDKNRVEQALRTVKDLLGDGDVVSENRVERITVDGGSVMLTLKLPTDDADIRRAVEDQCRDAVKIIDGVAGVMIMSKGATDPAARLAVAKRMRDSSATYRQNPAERYVVLQKAMELAGAAGDVRSPAPEKQDRQERHGSYRNETAPSERAPKPLPERSGWLGRGRARRLRARGGRQTQP